jgi:hypothetical protein
MLRLIFLFFFNVVWLKTPLAGICYLYLLCGCRVQDKGGEGEGELRLRRKRTAAVHRKKEEKKGQERAQERTNPMRILVGTKEIIVERTLSPRTHILL